MIEFGELITKELAGVLLNSTCDASDKEFPVIVTYVPPSDEPTFGDMFVTAGP